MISGLASDLEAGPPPELERVRHETRGERDESVIAFVELLEARRADGFLPYFILFDNDAGRLHSLAEHGIEDLPGFLRGLSFEVAEGGSEDETDSAEEQEMGGGFGDEANEPEPSHDGDDMTEYVVALAYLCSVCENKVHSGLMKVRAADPGDAERVVRWSYREEAKEILEMTVSPIADVVEIARRVYDSLH